MSSNLNKNNLNFPPYHAASEKLSPQIGSPNDDMTNPYEAIMNQNQPLGPESNVLTYNDAGLLTMDPRSGAGLLSMQGSEQPPLPLLPPPLPPNQHTRGNFLGNQDAGRPFIGNKFEFVTADFNSEAESRVTDWVNQQQEQQGSQNDINCDFNAGVDTDIRGHKGNVSLLANYSADIDNPSGDDNMNDTSEMVFESLQVDRHRLKLGCLLQEGTFGRVYQVNITYSLYTM